MMNRKGQMGTSVTNIYRVLMVSVIAFTVFFLSSMFYDYEISVRDSEALIFAREMVDCVAPDGVLDLDSLGEGREGIFAFCGFDELESERYFLSISIGGSVEEIDRLVDGDEGLEWVQKVYGGEFKTESIEKYEPGYYNGVFLIRILEDGVYGDIEMGVEVIVKDEF